MLDFISQTWTDIRFAFRTLAKAAEKAALPADMARALRCLWAKLHWP
jgi:hypothetical protein